MAQGIKDLQGANGGFTLTPALAILWIRYRWCGQSGGPLCDAGQGLVAL